MKSTLSNSIWIRYSKISHREIILAFHYKRDPDKFSYLSKGLNVTNGNLIIIMKFRSYKTKRYFKMVLPLWPFWAVILCCHSMRSLGKPSIVYVHKQNTRAIFKWKEKIQYHNLSRSLVGSWMFSKSFSEWNAQVFRVGEWKTEREFSN